MSEPPHRPDQPAGDRPGGRGGPHTRIETAPDRSPPHPVDDTPPHVLEAIERGPALRTTPTAVLCPGCGTEVATYEAGLPQYIVHFQKNCPSCEIALRRWSVVALPLKTTDSVGTDELARTTQQYWDRHLWAGITTLGHPRNEEFTQAYTDRATDYGWDWEVRCPLCRRTLSELSEHRLDYHHWNRGKGHDRGCCFCRDCHDALNDGQFDSDIDWQAREAGFSGKHDLQIARLAAREVLVAGCGSLDELARRLVQRYYIPYTPEYVRGIISQTFVDSTIRDLIGDDAVRQGVVEHA